MKALWSSSIPVGEDKDARAWVWNRLVPTKGHRQDRDTDHSQVLEAIMNQDLARAIRLNANRPSWLRHTDNRLMLPLYNGMGQLRSCKVRPLPGPEGKGYSPKNFDATGLVFANTTARDMLGTGRAPAGWPKDEPFRLIVCEGEVDWMTWCVHDELGAGDARETPPPAIIGVFSGSWTQALAERVPNSARVIIRNDRDQAGEGYARKAFELLSHRCHVRWLGPELEGKQPDDNDRYLAGKLGADPEEGTEVMQAEGDQLVDLASWTFAARYSADDLDRDRDRLLVSTERLPPWTDTGSRSPYTGHGWGRHLNSILGGGLRGGEMVAIGATTAKAGKTSWLMQAVDGLALQSVEVAAGRQTGPVTPVVVISEMSVAALTWRSLARWLGRDSSWFRAGASRPSREQGDVSKMWDDAHRALSHGAFADSRRFMLAVPPRMVTDDEDSPGLFTIVERWVDELDVAGDVVPIVVMDPVQRFQGRLSPSGASAVETLDAAAETLREWTDKGQWVTLLTSDTNKESASGRTKKEGLDVAAACLRGSYSLTHEVSAVLRIRRLIDGTDRSSGRTTVYGETAYEAAKEGRVPPREIVVEIHNNRSGPDSGELHPRFDWQPETGRFYPVDREATKERQEEDDEHVEQKKAQGNNRRNPKQDEGVDAPVCGDMEA